MSHMSNVTCKNNDPYASHPLELHLVPLETWMSLALWHQHYQDFTVFGGT